ncbi:MAG: glycosyltransferase family 4 protein [Actinobacteria bacterium]|nr:glycosyltransferase family 4 protein [Actinomycetota bacterium]
MPRASGAAIHFVQDFSISTSFTWISADAVRALHALGHQVSVQPGRIAATVEPAAVDLLRRLQAPARPDQAHVRWSHYWEPYARQSLAGAVNLDIVALNHALVQPTGSPSDRWMEALARAHTVKLAISQFTRNTVLQNGVDPRRIALWNLGYTPEIDTVADARALDGAPGFRFLHVTNATDPARFGTDLVLDAFAQEFGPDDGVSLVVKDHNPAGDAIRELIANAAPRAPLRYLAEYSSRATLVRAYRACHALAAPFRGEGYGIKVVDALACGLPVIAPLFCGITDFCNHDRIFALDYQCEDARPCVDVVALGPSGRPVWCLPVIQSICARMREVAAQPARARSRAAAAERYVKKWFSWADAARTLVEIVTRLESPDGQTGAVDTPAPA